MQHDPLDPPSPDDQRFRSLVDAINDYSIYLLDAHGHVQTWNSGAQLSKHYAAEDVIGRSFSLFFSVEDIQQHIPQRLLDNAARDGRAAVELWHLRKDGSRFWAGVALHAIRDAQGQLTGFAKITRDLSERQSQQAALRASEERFRMAMQHSAVGMALIGLDA